MNEMQIKVKILYFASVKELTKVQSEELNIPAESLVSDLKILLVEKYPVLAPQISNLIVSTNKNFSLDTDAIPESAEIAVFPPVSGGSEEKVFAAIVNSKIEFEEIIEQITSNVIGAVCTFTGLVRGKTNLERGVLETEYLEYETYSEMAEIKLRQIGEEILEKWPDVDSVAIVQRIGHLDVGEHSVNISCSSSHRKSGIFQSVEYGINRLKEIVPVWKKEVSSSGETWIEGDYHPRQDD